jgi:hypothetical protein
MFQIHTSLHCAPASLIARAGGDHGRARRERCKSDAIWVHNIARTSESDIEPRNYNSDDCVDQEAPTISTYLHCLLCYEPRAIVQLGATPSGLDARRFREQACLLAMTEQKGAGQQDYW